MASLRKTDSGRLVARKAIPVDVRGEYQRLFGPAWEAKLRLEGTESPAEARIRVMEWQSEVEARIEAIRANQRGEAQGLTHREARALAGEWYQWFLGRNEGRPSGPERWGIAFEMLADEILDMLPDEMRDQPSYDLEALLKHEDVRNGIRPLIEG